MSFSGGHRQILCVVGREGNSGMALGHICRLRIYKYTHISIAVHTRDGHHLSDNGDHHRIWQGKEESISKGVLFWDLTMTTSFDTILWACRNGDQKAQNVSILTKAGGGVRWQWHGLGRQHNGIIHLSIQQKTSQITSHAATCPPGQFVTHPANNAKSQFDHFLCNFSFTRRTI